MTCSSLDLNLKNHVDKWMFFLGQCRSEQTTAQICLNRILKHEVAGVKLKK